MSNAPDLSQFPIAVDVAVIVAVIVIVTLTILMARKDK